MVRLPRQHRWAFVGGALGAMAAVALALALAFGSWSSLDAFTLTDLEVVCYAGWATVLIPVLLFTFLLRSVSAVTIAFSAILEPLMSIGFACALGTLSLPLLGWMGVGCIFLSMLIQMVVALLSVTSSTRGKESMRYPASSTTIP